MGDRIIIAPKGGGKTSLIRELVASETVAGRSCGGVLSEAVFEAGQRVGYDAVDLRTGERSILARSSAVPGEGPSVGNYRFSIEGLQLGIQAILDALEDAADVIVIDEVGPLEVRGEGWAEAFRRCLAEASGGQSLVIAVRPSLVDVLPEVFPSKRWEKAERVSPE